MKLALVVPGGVDRSGTERVIPVLLWLIERLVRAGDEVHVFALKQEPEPGTWPLLGATIHNAGKQPRRRTLQAMRREDRRAPFDIVHAFWAGAPGQVAAAFNAVTGVPFAVTLPGGDLAAILDIGYGALLRWRSRLATRLVLARASAIVAPSQWIAAHAAALGWTTVTIPFGVALDRWPVSPPRARKDGEPLSLIHVASLNRVKDPFGLLDAMRRLADRNVDFTLQIVGEDTLGGAVQRHCTSLALGDRVTFHPFEANDLLHTRVKQADLLVMNSRHEGASIILLEAAICGVPTVGTAVGMIADWSPEAAIAVPVQSPEPLAHAIQELAEDDSQRLRLAKAAQARALAHDADAYTGQLRSLYEKLARSRRRSS
jgi:glycosyltransferase involved in cell wall biosynthesis